MATGDTHASLHVESAGAGPPLVLLHGWAMHSGLWTPVLSRFTRRFRVHAVDLPGHGWSPTVEPYSLAAIVDAVARACGDFEEPATVLGWSLGGAVAMRWALAEPRRIARLVLVSATPCFAARADWNCAIDAETLARFNDELTVSYEMTLQRFVALQVRGSEHAQSVLAGLRSQLFARGKPSRETLGSALALLQTVDLRAQVPAIAQPTLVVSGERDVLAPAAALAWLARNLQDGRHAPIAGAAHAPFLSHPDEFFAAFDDFADGA